MDPIAAISSSPVHALRMYASSAPVRVVSPPSQPGAERLARLSAGRVREDVDLWTPTPGTPAGAASGPAGTLPMYRHPADRNAAATGVRLGLMLDVSA